MKLYLFSSLNIKSTSHVSITHLLICQKASRERQVKAYTYHKESNRTDTFFVHTSWQRKQTNAWKVYVRKDTSRGLSCRVRRAWLCTVSQMHICLVPLHSAQVVWPAFQCRTTEQENCSPAKLHAPPYCGSDWRRIPWQTAISYRRQKFGKKLVPLHRAQ